MLFLVTLNFFAHFQGLLKRQCNTFALTFWVVSIFWGTQWDVQILHLNRQNIKKGLFSRLFFAWRWHSSFKPPFQYFLLDMKVTSKIINGNPDIKRTIRFSFKDASLVTTKLLQFARSKREAVGYHCGQIAEPRTQWHRAMEKLISALLLLTISGSY